MEEMYTLHVRNTSRCHSVNFCLLLSDGDEDLNETKSRHKMVFDFKPLVSRYAEIRPLESHTFVWKNEITLGWAEYGRPWHSNGKDGYHVWRSGYYNRYCPNMLTFTPAQEFNAFQPIQGTTAPEGKVVIVPENGLKPEHYGISMCLGDLVTTPVWVTPGTTYSLAKKPQLWMVDACGRQETGRWLGNVHMVKLTPLEFPHNSLEHLVTM
jgi:hypothetical protein